MDAAAIPYGYCHCGCGEKTSLARDTDRNRGHVKGEPRKFIRFHHLREINEGRDRLAYSVVGDCWVSTRKPNNRIGHITDTEYSMLHRRAYATWVGELLPGMHIHHICENKACIKPEHLEQVTPLEHGIRHRRFTAADAERMHELRSEGWTHQAIADELGCAQSYVSTTLSGRRWAEVAA